MFKEELTPILHNPFQKTEEDRILHTSLCETSIILVPKLDKDGTKKYIV